MTIVEIFCGYFSISSVKTGILVIYMEWGSTHNSVIIMKMFDKIVSHSLITHGSVSRLVNELSSKLKAHAILESATPVIISIIYYIKSQRLIINYSHQYNDVD